MTTPNEQDRPVDRPIPETELGGEDTGADLEQLQASLAAAEARALESKDLYMRALAEIENVRKRASRDVEAAHKYAVERFAGDLIDVKDSLELGLSSAAGSGAAAGNDALRAGTEATLKLLPMPEATTRDRPTRPHPTVALRTSARRWAASASAPRRTARPLAARSCRAAMTVAPSTTAPARAARPRMHGCAHRNLRNRLIKLVLERRASAGRARDEIPDGAVPHDFCSTGVGHPPAKNHRRPSRRRILRAAR